VLCSRTPAATVDSVSKQYATFSSIFFPAFLNSGQSASLQEKLNSSSTFSWSILHPPLSLSYKTSDVLREGRLSNFQGACSVLSLTGNASNFVLYCVGGSRFRLAVCDAVGSCVRMMSTTWSTCRGVCVVHSATTASRRKTANEQIPLTWWMDHAVERRK